MRCHRTWKHWLGYAGVRLIEISVTRLPVEWSVGLGGFLGRVFHRLTGIRRALVREQIALAFPEKSPAEVRSLARRTYVEAGRSLFENFHLACRDPLRHTTFTVHGDEHLARLRVRREGFIVVTGHVGNWELMGAHFARGGLPLHVIARPLHNDYIDRHVVKTRREAGLRVIPSHGVPIHDLAQLIRRGAVVVFVFDQDARQHGTFVEFLGRLASTPRGAALLALRTRCPILPAYALRQRGSRHEIYLFPPLIPLESPPDIDRAVQALTQRFTRCLEAVVRRAPEQYFWLHDRWKTPPAMVRPKRRRRAGLRGEAPASRACALTRLAVRR